MWTLFDEFTAVEGGYVLRAPVWEGGNFVVTCDQIPVTYNRPWCRLDVGAFPVVAGTNARVVFQSFRGTTKRFGNVVAGGTVPFPSRRFGYYFFNSSGVNGFTVQVYRLP